MDLRQIDIDPQQISAGELTKIIQEEEQEVE